MSNEDITLTAGDAEVTVQPGNGGRVGGLRVGGIELLRQGERFGCFPMVPWCGRIRDGRFLDGATVRQMPLNSPPHAIHGTARDGAWSIAALRLPKAGLWELYARYRTATKAYADDASECGTLVGVSKASARDRSSILR